MNKLAKYVDHFDTPLGVMEVVALDDALLSIYFVDQVQTVHRNAVTESAKQQLLEYFEGRRTRFDLPMAAKGTDFQKRVWDALTTIRFGETCCYADIANKINNPKAVRAVGAANGKNPMTIVVPCHRVIGSNGSLTGYAFGVERKAWLLAHESDSLSFLTFVNYPDCS